MEYNNNDDIFGPRKITFIDVIITSAGGFISGVIGSVILLFIFFIMSSIVDIPIENESMLGFSSKSPVFPFVMSVATLFIGIIVMSINYFFLTITDGDKYKKTLLHFLHISLFGIIIYFLLTPLYLYTGTNKYEYLLYIFIIHIIILSFGSYLLLEILNNYRYILIGFYGSFVGVIITGTLVFLIFSFFSDGYGKLLSLLLIVPLSTGLILFFKGIFEIIYYTYFKLTGLDQLGDIFAKIEDEEKESLKKAINENSTY